VQVSCEDQGGPVWRVALEPDSAQDGAEDVTVTVGGMEQLEAILEAAEASDACRVIVLDGRPGCFCRGMDLQDATTITAAERSRGSRLFAECLCRLRGARQLVVAAVDGDAVAGGLGLAAAADVVIATDRSAFGLPELMLGLLPAMVLPLLRERMGAHQARRLALGATSIPAEHAQALGLVDERCADAAALDKKVRAVVKTALRLQPDAVAELKRFTADIASMDHRDAIHAGRAVTDERLARPETMAAIQGFLAGDPVPWLDRYRPGKPQS